YSEKLECRHCHNIAPMRVVGDVADTTVEHLAGSPPIEHGTIYEVLSCPKCEQVTIRSGRWYEMMEPEDWHGDIIYPSLRPQIQGLPANVAKEFDAAERVATI